MTDNVIEEWSHLGFVELFAGVGGFRLGLERVGWRAVWSNQWEPASNRQHASAIYVNRFGPENHSNEDIGIALDRLEAGDLHIPAHSLVVGGFPCQDYSVAKPLNQATGLQGNKGVLWWQIFRLINLTRPTFLLLENVDRLMTSPAHQRGRDFAVMLACLSDLGYTVEWRVVNAADYGFPQKRRRVFIVAEMTPSDYHHDRPEETILRSGVLAEALPVAGTSEGKVDFHSFAIDGALWEVTQQFGSRNKVSPFANSGLMRDRLVTTVRTTPTYDGLKQTLSDVLEDHSDVPENYVVPAERLDSWRYLKGAKSEARKHKRSDFTYHYTEGALPFPDPVDRPARTVLTSEIGASPSRMRHIISAGEGNYRRLTPVELERLNGFPDGWTKYAGTTDSRRGFLMGNALVVGLVERIGAALIEKVPSDSVVPPGGLPNPVIEMAPGS